MEIVEKSEGVKRGRLFLRVGESELFKFGHNTVLSSIQNKFVLDFR